MKSDKDITKIKRVTFFFETQCSVYDSVKLLHESQEQVMLFSVHYYMHYCKL